MTDVFLVIGATGFIGGFLTAELLRQGHHVIALVRSKNGRSGDARMQALLSFFGLEPGNRLETVEGHLELPGLGLDQNTRNHIRSKVYSVLHCAAETSFAARRRDRVTRVNLDSLGNLLDVATGCRHLYYMSTAYAAGVQQGRIMERLANTEAFHNAYEQSKHLAEKRINRWAVDTETPLTIIRPSIVYGDSVNGRALRFNALYYPVRILLMLKEKLETDIRKNNGARARELEAVMDDQGVMTLPLTIPDSGGWIDLIPVDHLVRSVLPVMASGKEGVFHIVNPTKNNLAGLIDLIQAACSITGIRTVVPQRNHSPTPLETLIDRYMAVYAPYLCDKRLFDDTRSRPILEAAGVTCPILDRDVFKTCITYAVQQAFGARIII